MNAAAAAAAAVEAAEDVVAEIGAAHRSLAEGLLGQPQPQKQPLRLASAE